MFSIIFDMHHCCCDKLCLNMEVIHVRLSLDVTVITPASPVDTISQWEELLKNVTSLKVMKKTDVAMSRFKSLYHKHGRAQ